MGKGPTSNILNQQWVFVNKDSKSKSLTRSSGAEKTLIYGHVRQHMVRDNLVIEQEFDNVFRDGGAKPAKVPKRRPRRASHPVGTGLTVFDGNERPSRIDEEKVSKSDGNTLLPQTDLEIVGTVPQFSIPGALDAVPYSRSYEYFRQMTISEATGFADRMFWDAAMQLSASNEAVFHALTSLGALHESLMTPNETSRAEYHQASLMHCNRAIGAVVAGDGQMSLPLVLVTCVIFGTIQIFDDAPMAQRTLESGIRLVTLAQKQLSTFSDSEQAVLDLAARMIERYQSRLTLVLLPTTVVKEHIDNGDLVDDMPKVPLSFESLLQAREILQAICDWSFHVLKSPASLVLTDNLQKQWIRAIIKLSETSGLHPLSMRSLNLLKIARLASACLIAAQHMTREVEFDESFPAFKHVLNMYGAAFRLCKSNAIFTTVFHIDAGIVDLLNEVVCNSPTSEFGLQAHDALAASGIFEDTMDLDSYNETGRARQEDGQQDAETGRLRIKSLDFFAQSGLARLRLKRATWSGFNPATTEVRWFSILDSSPEPHFLNESELKADSMHEENRHAHWTTYMPRHNGG